MGASGKSILKSALGIPVPILPLRGWAGRVLGLIFPPLCLVCGQPVAATGSLCAECWKAADFIDGPVCAVCGMPFEVDPGPDAVCGGCLARSPSFAAARAVLRYGEASKGPILALKHADRLDLAPQFALWLQRAGAELIASADVIVPVPLHRARLWRRRYNQAAEIGRHLAVLTGMTFAPLALCRRRATKSQGDMASAKARRRNVHGAFAVPAGERATLCGKTVLLIDDVMTTGATVEACAKTLRRAGAEKVLVLALARVVRTPALPI